MEDIFDKFTIAIAALAALLSYFASREARTSSQKSSEAAYKISSMQFELQARDLRLQYHNEIRTWATNAIECMGDIIALCYLDPKKCQFNFRERQVLLANKLSSLIDSGRWFFPNDKSFGVGLHKEVAFQGYRQNVLDQLVAVFDLTILLNYNERNGNGASAKEVGSRKRQFTSIIQGYVQTEEWTKMIEQLDKEQSSTK